MSEVTTEQVLDQLRTVMLPQVNRDIVSLGFVRDVTVCNGIVGFRITLPPPFAGMKEMLSDHVRNLVGRLPGVGQVNAAVEVAAAPKPAERAPLPGIKNIVAVSSGKGGVGKSTVAVNLAVALVKDGFKVGIMDCDVYGPNVPIMMGNLADPREANNKILPPSAHGVKVISLGLLQPGDKPVIWRGPMLHGLVKQFLNDVDWGRLDYLIVDMPPGTGDVQLSLAQLVPVTGAVLVTTPQEVSMTDVRKATNMFLQVQIPVLGIVENMSYFLCPTCDKRHEIFGHGGGAELAHKYNVPFLGEVPLSSSVREGGDKGMPIMASSPDSVQGQAFKQIAKAVAAEIARVATPLPSINVK